MAKEIVCDRCGKTSENLNGYGHLLNLRIRKYIGLNAINLSSCEIDMDLCEDCVDSLKKFVHYIDRENKED